MPGLRRLGSPDLPAGFADGFAFTAPVVDMGRYLPWLQARLAAAGGFVVVRRVTDLAELHGDAVVNCSGLGARGLVDYEALVPVRGQVVRVANPGLTDWVLDEEDPAGLTYVIPRIDDVVCGGTVDVGATGGEVDPAVEAAILRRAIALVPPLAGSPVVSRALGWRPVRPEVRLEREGCVVHCYGHGGAGVTLSWACADDVAALLP